MWVCCVCALNLDLPDTRSTHCTHLPRWLPERGRESETLTEGDGRQGQTRTDDDEEEEKDETTETLAEAMGKQKHETQERLGLR